MANEDFAVGVNAKMAIEPGTVAKADTYTFDSGSYSYDFLREDVKRQRRIIGGNEIRGTRTAPSIRTRFGAYMYGGPILKYISPIELEQLIPLFLGDIAAGIYTADNDIPYFSLLIDRDSAVLSTSLFQYNNSKFDKIVFRGRAPATGEQGQPDLVTFEARIKACDQWGGPDNDASGESTPTWPGTIPAFGTASNYEPYVFQDCDSNVTVAGVGSCPIEEFVIMIDNDIEAKYVNAVKPYALKPRNRIVRVRLKVPWNDVTDPLYDQTKVGAAASLKLVNDAMSTLFEFGTLQVDDVTPTASSGKGQISLIIDAIARSTAANGYDLQITNDSVA